MPWEVTCFLAQEAFKQKKIEVGLMMLFCFELYLRPGEVRKIRVMDLVPPVRSADPSSRTWSVVLHPMELEEPSKTGEFDETVTFDRAGSSFIPVNTVRLLKLKQRRKEELIFSETPAFLKKVMEAIFKKHQLGVIGPPHPYRLRHGGASRDFLLKRRSLEEIQRRGRWKSFSSVRRYEKGGRLNQLLHLLPEDKLKAVVQAADNIEKTVQSLR
jgi:hypothetical protein